MRSVLSWLTLSGFIAIIFVLYRYSQVAEVCCRLLSMNQSKMLEFNPIGCSHFPNDSSLKHSDPCPTVQRNDVPEIFSLCGKSREVQLGEVHTRGPLTCPFCILLCVQVVIVPHTSLQHVLLCISTLKSRVSCDIQIVN